MKPFLILISTLLFVSSTEVTGYRKWHKVTPKPLKMRPAIATLCAPPTGQPSNPHGDRYFTVYVNQIGRVAMASPTAHFPVGSVVVKEKLPTASAAQPELLTVMVKRTQGYFPEGGDWEYQVYDRQLRQIEAGRLTLCAACHQKAPDWVFRELNNSD
ncbi:MAG: cytochrome P460 family protein [Candidatus Bathyarchaeia archaeon]